MQVADVVRARIGPQVGWALAMMVGAIASGCLLLGLPLYGWAHARLLRLHLEAAGVPTGGVRAEAAASAGLALGALALVLAGLVGAAATGAALDADRPFVRALGAVVGALAFAEGAAPLLGVLPRLLDERGGSRLLDALGASLYAPPLLPWVARAGLAVALTAPAAVLLAWDDPPPFVAPLAVLAAVAVLLFGTAELARRYAAAPPRPAHRDARAAPFVGWVAATVVAGVLSLVPLSVSMFLPLPMRALEGEPIAASALLPLPQRIDGTTIDLRSYPEGILVARLDGGGAGKVRAQGGRAVERVQVEELADARGYRVRALVGDGLEAFELDPRGVRLDDHPLARMERRVGFQGGVLMLVAVLAWVLATRTLPRLDDEPSESEGWVTARTLLGVAFACAVLVVAWVATAALGT